MCARSILWNRRRALGLALILGALFPWSAAQAEPTAHGAILPTGAHQVGKDRYQSPSPYSETLKFYSKIYSSEHFPRRLIADLPGIRAVHLTNAGSGAWEGLNIYEMNGATRIYVLVRGAESQLPKGRPAR